MRLLLTAAVILLSFSQAPAALLAYWNFNSGTPSGPSYSTSIAIPANTGSASISLANWGGSVGGFTNQTTTTNALNGDSGGNSFSLSGAAGSGTYIDFILSSSGYENLVISFPSFRTGQAYSRGTWQYSTDGTNFFGFNPADGTPSDTYYAIPGGNNWSTLQTIQLPTGTSDATSLTVRYILSNTSGDGSNAFYRLDNIQINGTAIPEPAAPLLAALSLITLVSMRRRS